MKKIIALILALACILALASCAAEGVNLDAYKTAIANTAPSSVIISVTTYDTAFGVELTGTYTVTYYEDSTARVVGEYQVMNSATTDELTSTIPVDATIAADGTVTGDGVSASVAAAAGLSIDLGAPIKSSIVARGILTANIEQANTAAVLGAELPSDASLELRMADSEGTKIGQATINYSDDRGTVRIVCQYD